MEDVTAVSCAEFDKLIDMIKDKSLKSPRELAGLAFNELSSYMKNAKWSHRDDLYADFCSLLDLLSKDRYPHTVVVENIALRILKIMHQIFYSRKDNYQENPEFADQVIKQYKSNLVLGSDRRPKTPEDISVFYSQLIEELNLYRLELESSVDEISYQSIQHIHTGETIMIYGHSQTVEHFIRNAAKRRKFRVIVCQTFPDNVGNLMVARLSTAPNIEITLIPDSCISAMMARVNKIILTCYSVSADGSLCTRSGVYGLVLSAAQYSIPIMVCAGLYKMSPRYNFLSSVYGRDVDYSFLKSPCDVINYSLFRSLNQTDVINPTFDFIPAEYVTLFITNKGDFAPSYIYRILNEMYRIDED